MSERAHRQIVNVVAPARLHLGFLDMRGDLGRIFGGVGLAIAGPHTHFRAFRSNEMQVVGNRTDAKRILDLAKRFKDAHQLEHNYTIEVVETITPHAGLGSGTQLAVATGAALARLEALDLRPQQIAETLGRGVRSAIGIAAFETGGLLVDGGHKPETTGIAPIISRLAFPEEWRMLLVFDPNQAGVHGAQEKQAFQTLPPLENFKFAETCQSVLMQMLPAVAEQDIVAFGKAVTNIQTVMGQQFAPAQSGSAWASQSVNDFMAALNNAPVYGIGQSSWGPTGFCFLSSQRDANDVLHKYASTADTLGLKLEIVSARNQGAKISVSEREPLNT